VTLIKICGVTDRAAVEASAAGGADYIGFVFFEGSPRHLGFAQAEALASACPARLRRIGLFVDADDALLERAIAAGRLNGVQLHGNEAPARAAEVGGRFGVEVWKAIGIAARADVARAQSYRSAATRVLFDAKPAPSAERPGGLGVRFDWRLLAGAEIGMNWGLAGGVDASNVAEAIAATGAPLVDVSSGVEYAPAVKSPAKIRDFCQAVRA
jgi:phosphoribosylanthranilate isomerase